MPVLQYKYSFIEFVGFDDWVWVLGFVAFVSAVIVVVLCAVRHVVRSKRRREGIFKRLRNIE